MDKETKNEIKALIFEARQVVKIYDRKLDENVENGDELMALVVIARDLAKIKLRK